MLAACRSLREAGYSVAAASHTALAPAKWSRACDRRVHLPDPRRDATGFIEQLRSELAQHPYAALLPGSDGALLAISQARERLPATVATGLPPHTIVQRALSRTHLAEAARAAGFAEIASVTCADLQDALDAARELGYPVALKSAEAAHADAGAVTGAAKGRLVHDEAALRRAAPDFRGALLLQPFLAGDPVSFAGVFADGRLLAIAASRYVRMWPPDGGSVAFGETIAAPSALAERVRRLLAALQWQGIFELELIHAAQDRFVPIDLNPRPYGSMALADAAGAPLAAVWCNWLLSHEPLLPREPLQARPGVRYRWEDGDLRTLAWHLRRGQLQAALRTAQPRRHVVHAHVRRDDPAPLLARIAYLGKRALGGGALGGA